MLAGDEDEVKERETKQEYILLCDWIKQQLGDKVAKVQVSKRLSSSPCVLVSGKFGLSANMERYFAAFQCSKYEQWQFGAHSHALFVWRGERASKAIRETQTTKGMQLPSISKRIANVYTYQVSRAKQKNY
ncbi:hypothetical protein U1Q18_027471 [Sarracenia purpurea var. burkii]